MSSGAQPGVCRHRLKSPFNLLKPTGWLSPARAVYPPRCFTMLPSPEPLAERVFKLGLETLCIVIRGSPLDWAPPVGRSFSYGSVVSYQPRREERSCFSVRGDISQQPGAPCESSFGENLYIRLSPSDEVKMQWGLPPGYLIRVVEIV